MNFSAEALLRKISELEAQNALLTKSAAEMAQKLQDIGPVHAEREFYAGRMAELEAHNAVLTKSATEMAQKLQDIGPVQAERDFYASRIAELEEHNRLLTEAATEWAQRVQEQEGTLHTTIEQLSKQSAMDRPLAFMHVPKTSGQALTVGLREALPSTHCLNCYDRGFFGALRSCKTILPFPPHQVHDALPPANGIDFVAGHITYSTLIQGRPEARFMTVLREPRSRILSLWTYYRSCSDETISLLAAFGRVVRLARRPLVEFLNHPEAACHTDNKYVRMLLWPHPLIPDDGFIDNASDERLACEAAARLKVFDFADVIENPRLEDNVRAFLARPFVYRRMNETPPMPSELQAPLEEELTREALLLVEHRSRLDHELWRALAAERIAGADPTALSDDTFRRTITRHAALMRPE